MQCCLIQHSRNNRKGVIWIQMSIRSIRNIIVWREVLRPSNIKTYSYLISMWFASKYNNIHRALFGCVNFHVLWSGFTTLSMLYRILSSPYSIVCFIVCDSPQPQPESVAKPYFIKFVFVLAHNLSEF